MNEETKELVRETLREAIEHSLEDEVVLEILEDIWNNERAFHENRMDDAVIRACQTARREWDI
jgi:uncharacterized protein YeeX (DUF496 family)